MNNEAEIKLHQTQYYALVKRGPVFIETMQENDQSPAHRKTINDKLCILKRIVRAFQFNKIYATHTR